jgi:hypothetical protein
MHATRAAVEEGVVPGALFSGLSATITSVVTSRPEDGA